MLKGRIVSVSSLTVKVGLGTKCSTVRTGREAAASAATGTLLADFGGKWGAMVVIFILYCGNNGDMGFALGRDNFWARGNDLEMLDLV